MNRAYEQLKHIGALVVESFDFEKAAKACNMILPEEAHSAEELEEKARDAVSRAIQGASWNDEGGEAEVCRGRVVAKATRRKWLDDCDAFTGRLGKFCLKVELRIDIPTMSCAVAQEEKETAK